MRQVYRRGGTMETIDVEIMVISRDIWTQCVSVNPSCYCLPQMTNLWAAFPPDVAGNVDYKNICYVITHGEEKEE